MSKLVDSVVDSAYDTWWSVVYIYVCLEDYACSIVVAKFEFFAHSKCSPLYALPPYQELHYDVFNPVKYSCSQFAFV